MDLEIDRRDGVCVLRINRPEVRNALSPEVVRGLGEALGRWPFAQRSA